ncbi:DHA2 family efflux MFS transporter permease subunit [Nostocoides australiense]|nr:DHA2 family efflux MFS transporter permease subunit [Tetrasphaera australiensis]
MDTATMTRSTTLTSRPRPAITGRARTLALVSLLLASAMELIDVTIVNVALPTIERSLGASGAMLQWVVAAYPLAFGISLITGARLGDRFGRRRLFLVGLVAFTLASAACGLAPSAAALVGFRAVQGIAAAAMVPQVLTSIQVMYAPHERGKAMAAFSALAGLAAVVGPIMGSVLTETAGWRWVFLVNVPVGVLALVAALRFVPESRAAHANRVDFRGVAVLSAGLLALLYPLVMGHELGWPTWTYAVMAAGAVILAAFVAAEARHERAGDEPLVATSLYRDRAFSGGSLVGGLLFIAGTGYFLAGTIYFQAGLGWSVLKAGLVNIPFALICTVTAGAGAAVLMARIGRRVLSLGAVVMAVGAVVMWLTVRDATPATSFWAFVPAICLIGAGFGFVVSSTAPLALGQVPDRQAGSASGQFNTTGQLANAVGAAVMGTLFFEVAGRQHTHAPAEIFRPAFLVVLTVMAALLLLVAVATTVIPADAHEHADPDAGH